ncbi:hypothetical protein LSAT2_032736 [Lamellibrachia satsuma]|nr:hypothetical protein LSAT2_032736 [Lamellibrachia satsuma]
MQQQNVIHADLKPDNLLLQSADDWHSVKVIDFGNAIRCVHNELSLYYDDFELQTLLYRAPEVMFGVPFSMEVDMWSLGCVLAELYTGQPLFRGRDTKSVLRKIVQLLSPLPVDIFQRGKFFPDFHEFTSKVTQPDATLLLLKKLGIRDFAFASFIAQLLVYDPGARSTVTQAAQHPFLAPEIGLSHLLQPSNSGEGCGYHPMLLMERLYQHHPRIAPNLTKLHMSSLDLLHHGTSCVGGDTSPHSETLRQRSCSAIDTVRKVAQVTPVMRQQLPPSPPPAVEPPDSTSLDPPADDQSRQTMTSRTEHRVSSPTRQTTGIRVEDRVSSMARQTTGMRVEDQVSSPARQTTGIRVEDRVSSPARQTTGTRVEDWVSSPAIVPNSSLPGDWRTIERNHRTSPETSTTHGATQRPSPVRSTTQGTTQRPSPVRTTTQGTSLITNTTKRTMQTTSPRKSTTHGTTHRSAPTGSTTQGTTRILSPRPSTSQGTTQKPRPSTTQSRPSLSGAACVRHGRRGSHNRVLVGSLDSVHDRGMSREVYSVQDRTTGSSADGHVDGEVAAQTYSGDTRTAGVGDRVCLVRTPPDGIWTRLSSNWQQSRGVEQWGPDLHEMTPLRDMGSDSDELDGELSQHVWSRTVGVVSLESELKEETAPQLQRVQTRTTGSHVDSDGADRGMQQLHSVQNRTVSDICSGSESDGEVMSECVQDKRGTDQIMSDSRRGRRPETYRHLSRVTVDGDSEVSPHSCDRQNDTVDRVSLVNELDRETTWLALRESTKINCTVHRECDHRTGGHSMSIMAQCLSPNQCSQANNKQQEAGNYQPVMTDSTSLSQVKVTEKLALLMSKKNKLGCQNAKLRDRGKSPCQRTAVGRSNPTLPGWSNLTPTGWSNRTLQGRRNLAPPDWSNPNPPSQSNPTPPGLSNPTPPGLSNPNPPSQSNLTPPGWSNPTPPGQNNPPKVHKVFQDLKCYHKSTNVVDGKLFSSTQMKQSPLVDTKTSPGHGDWTPKMFMTHIKSSPKCFASAPTGSRLMVKSDACISKETQVRKITKSSDSLHVNTDTDSVDRPPRKPTVDTKLIEPVWNERQCQHRVVADDKMTMRRNPLSCRRSLLAFTDEPITGIVQSKPDAIHSKSKNLKSSGYESMHSDDQQHTEDMLNEGSYKHGKSRLDSGQKTSCAQKVDQHMGTASETPNTRTVTGMNRIHKGSRKVWDGETVSGCQSSKRGVKRPVNQDTFSASRKQNRGSNYYDRTVVLCSLTRDDDQTERTYMEEVSCLGSELKKFKSLGKGKLQEMEGANKPRRCNVYVSEETHQDTMVDTAHSTQHKHEPAPKHVKKHNAQLHCWSESSAGIGVESLKESPKSVTNCLPAGSTTWIASPDATFMVESTSLSGQQATGHSDGQSLDVTPRNRYSGQCPDVTPRSGRSGQCLDIGCNHQAQQEQKRHKQSSSNVDEAFRVRQSKEGPAAAQLQIDAQTTRNGDASPVTANSMNDDVILLL